MRYIPDDEYIKMNDYGAAQLFAEVMGTTSVGPSGSEQVFMAVRNIRHDELLTQAQLAKLADIPQSVISRLESKQANPTIKVLEKIAQATDRELVISFKKKGNDD